MALEICATLRINSKLVSMTCRLLWPLFLSSVSVTLDQGLFPLELSIQLHLPCN